MGRIVLILSLIFVLAFVALAQSSSPPVAMYGGTRRNPRLIELSNMAADSEGCVKRGPYIGTLVQRKFDDDEITLIGFVLRDSKDQRTVSPFLAKGKRVKVWAYACGAAGRVLYADRIVAL